MCPFHYLIAEINTLHSLSSLTVVLLATSPSYFRGFTLIALKEGREGTVDDDYIGQFQVRMGLFLRENSPNG